MAKPQPKASDSPALNNIPNTSSIPGFTPQDTTAVQQAALRSLGRAPANPRETELVARAALNPQRLSELGIGASGGDLARTGVMMDQAAQQMGAAQGAQTQFQDQARKALPILEDALKMATGEGNRKLGLSSLFEEAGLTGFDNLSQSLAERVGEIEQRSTSFREILRDTFSNYQGQNRLLLDNAKFALDRYEALSGQYDSLQDQLFEIEKMKKEHEYDLQLMAEKARIDAAVASRRTQPASDLYMEPEEKVIDGETFLIQKPKQLGKGLETIIEPQGKLFQKPGTFDTGDSGSTFGAIFEKVDQKKFSTKQKTN